MSQQPPTGTVTFLFTDIQGSTQLWEKNSMVMNTALARHDALMRDAIEKNRGYVFKTIGDAFCAAFPTAPDGLNAALTAQRALQIENWGTTRIRARMALHTGSAEAREGDYFGRAVNRVARLLSAGHGGQVLLSLATQQLVRDHLPEGVRLHDLGTHRLKDLSEPEHIYQLVAPALVSAFPRLRTLDSRTTNLPSQTTPLVGREKHVAAAQQMLRQEHVRLLTLTGVAGIGKTRLGLQVAADLLDDFEHGVYFVPPPLLPPPSERGRAGVGVGIVQALGVRESGEAIGELIKEHLREKQSLLLLDEPDSSSAPFIGELLASCPRLKFLATSRERLKVPGENEFPVLPLALPDPGRVVRAGKEVAAAVARSAAVELFVQRAMAVQPNFALTNENALMVAGICERLFGLPLAIELTAARCNTLSLQTIRERLINRLGELDGEIWNSSTQNQVLQHVIAWSFDLLTDGEKILFSRLPVFVGGFTLEAAESVCSIGGEMAAERPDSGTIVASRRLAFAASMNIRDGVTALLAKNFLRVEQGVGNESRYVMPPLIRERALDLFSRSNEEGVIRRQYAEYSTSFAEKAEPKLRSAEQAAWLERLAHEHDNLRAALHWAKANKEIELGLRLSGALWRFWHTRGWLSEGRGWLEEFLSLAESNRAVGSDAARAKVLNGLGALAHAQGDFDSAEDFYEQALTLRREMDDKSGVAALLNNLGLVAQRQQQYKKAATFFEESGDVRRELGDKWGIAQALSNLALVAQQQGNYKKARKLFEESLALFRELKDKRSIAIALNSLGELARLQEEYTTAFALTDESQRLFRELGDEWSIAIALNTQADAAQFCAEYARAASLYNQCLRLRRELMDKVGIAFCFEGMAAVACAQGKPDRAARLLGAAEALRKSIRAPLPVADVAHHDQNCAAALAKLGKSKYEAEWATGRAMTLEQAMEYALET